MSNVCVLSALAGVVVERGHKQRDVVAVLNGMDGDAVDALWDEYIGPAIDELESRLG